MWEVGGAVGEMMMRLRNARHTSKQYMLSKDDVARLK